MAVVDVVVAGVAAAVVIVAGVAVAVALALVTQLEEVVRRHRLVDHIHDVVLRQSSLGILLAVHYDRAVRRHH